MATTLANLVSLVVDEVQIDPNNSIFSQDAIEKAIQRAYNRIQEDANFSLPENIIVTTLTVDEQEEDLPSNFVHIANPNGVKIDTNTPIAPVDYVELTGRADLTDSGKPYLYYVRYDTTNNVYVMGFYPSPSGSYTVTVPYCRSLPALSVSQDSILSSEFDEAIVNLSSYFLFRKIQGYESQANSYYQAYKDKIKSVKGNRQILDVGSLKVGNRIYNEDYYYNPRGL